MPTASPHSIEIFLQPGEHFVGDADYRIRTLLGSCVSITLWHPRRRMGGMSHFLLPERGLGAFGDAHGQLDGRYGKEALALMERDLEKVGIRARDCQAKLFGGGNMFPEHISNAMSVGRRNGDAARSLIAAYGIPVVSESLFGDGHRQIMLDVSTGDVWARRTLRPRGT